MAHKDRHIYARGVRREAGDLKRLGRALVELARAQAEADAQADAQAEMKAEAERAKRPVNVPATTSREQSKRPDESSGEAA